MKTKIIIISLTILTVGIANVFAQNKQKHNPEKNVEKKLEELDQALELDEKQNKKIKELLQTQAQEMKAMHEEMKKKMEALHEEMMEKKEQIRKKTNELREKHRERIAELLTPEQKTKYKKLQEEHKARKTPEARAKRQTLQLKEALKLDESQTKEVEKIMLEFAKKKDAMHQGKGMKQGKKGCEMHKMDDDKESKLKKVLSKEQFSEYLIWKKDHREKKCEQKCKK